MSVNGTRCLPEELISIVCDHYATQRQLGSLATLMRLNRRTSEYARTCLYRQYDFIDDRSSRFLEGVNYICEKYDSGDGLDQDILAAIDCREVDPLDLETDVRWLRCLRKIQVVEIKDMLYGRDIDNLLLLSTKLAEKGILLFPNLKEVVLSSRMISRIHSSEAKYPKRTPMNLLIAIFNGSNIKRMKFADSTIFTPPPVARNVLYARALRDPPEVNGRIPPGENSHISHAVIQFMTGMPALQEVNYQRVAPLIPIRPIRGIKHTISFRPLNTISSNPATLQISSSAGPSSLDPIAPGNTDQRSYIWEIRQAMIDIIHRSVIPLTEEEEDEQETEPSGSDSEDSGTEEQAQQRVPRNRPERRGAIGSTRRQSSWCFILPFSPESSASAGTLKMQVRDMVRRKYEDEGLVNEVLGNMSFEFKDD